MDPKYVLPRHESENDRLNLLAWAIDMAMGGSCLAPVVAPHEVLDVGCGTGLWAYDLGRHFPDAHVVGVDVLNFTDIGPPPNFEFREVNVLKGLPFDDETFDYVHQRFMVAAYPTRAYGAGVAELARVARPGAWVEVLEAVPPVESSGPVTRELWSYIDKLGRSADQDTLGLIPRRLELYLTEAGLIGVHTRTVTVPMGPWGAEVSKWRGRAGQLMTSSVRSLFTRLAPKLTQFGLEEEQCYAMIQTMLEEYNEFKSSFAFKVAFGQRPV